MKILATLLCVLSLVSLTCASISDCTWKHPFLGLSYNLKSLTRNPLTDMGYRVRDSRELASANYTYVFNVCDSISSPADSCEPTDAGTGPAPVFQLTPTLKCHRLGSQNLSHSFLHPLDRLDETAGISLTYTHGDRAWDTNRTYRSFSIHFLCVDRPVFEPGSKVYEDEINMHYQLSFETMFGCPSECPFAMNEKVKELRLCGGHGFCGIDNDSKAARCFCNDGRTGSDCMTAVTESSTSSPKKCDGVCAAVAVVVVIMGLLLIAALFMYYRLHRLDKMNLRFSALSDSFSQPPPAPADEPEHRHDAVISMRMDAPSATSSVNNGPSL
eukprot:TRINITY_DN4266_c0_g1_i1.p1 TRINITY_DN4266_c0_g1~~TRINITY_DN4266_c0_g1_i1.p1  ORF type:complete len:354 (-),score=43.35 TRINITY_DN4266_c0_g1_i1:498-1481(-)